MPIYFSYDVYFIGQNGFIINDNQKVYKSTNNGNNWFIQVNSPGYIKNFGWLSNQHGFIMGGAIVYETIDEGENWYLIDELTNVGLQKFSAPNAQIGYSVGSRGLIYLYIDTSIVPVELTLFEDKYSDNKVFLKWQTASELNNHGFEIQKSSDHINWKAIGFVQGMGATTLAQNYSYIDENINDEINYYRIKQIDLDGSFNYSKIIKVVSPIDEFKLYQNFPNPFNSSTNIRFAIPFNSRVEISLFDITGRLVNTIVNKEYQRGYYYVAVKSNELSSGIYFYRMTTGNGYSSIKKLTILK